MDGFVTEITKNRDKKHYISLLSVNGKNYYISTADLVCCGWETMVFSTAQELPLKGKIDDSYITSWAEIVCKRYKTEPTLKEHEKFVKDFTKEMDVQNGQRQTNRIFRGKIRRN